MDKVADSSARERKTALADQESKPSKEYDTCPDNRESNLHQHNNIIVILHLPAPFSTQGNVSIVLLKSNIWQIQDKPKGHILTLNNLMDNPGR